jgi:choline dehydrogenase-like flavoprotein
MARATGKLETITDAMVKSVDVDDQGDVNAVTYIDKKSGNSVSLPARVVVLAASACESARVLLNSKSSHFPDGLANSSGQVGRNLMDSTGSGLSAYIPALKGRPIYNEDGHTATHLFARGYHFELGTGFREPGTYNPPNLNGYGPDMKRQAKQDYGARVGLALRGEMVQNEHCYMEIDENVNDKWGIPVAKFHWKWSEQELNQVAHGLQTAKSILTTMGASIPSLPSPEEAIRKGGEVIHEVGTTRMGASPDDSVTNQYGQTWDCNKLFVMDGGVFASNPHKNCTLTIMTLAMRNASWLASQLDRGAI